MISFIFQRLSGAALVLFFVSIVAFTMIALVPGDAAAVMAGPDASPAELEELREQLGLTEPLPVRFALWFSSVVQGDLGTSIFGGEPVSTIIFERLDTTLVLAILGLLCALAIGIPLGMLAAVNHNTLLDDTLRAISLLALAIPNFWLGLMLILLFVVELGWLPIIGYVPVTEDISGLVYLVLPSLALGVVLAATVARMTRTFSLEVLGEDYVRTAHSKGLGLRVVLFKHVLRNSLIPVITVVGVMFGSVLSGTVVIENVFNLPGIGKLAITAVQARDYPVIQGIILYGAALQVAMAFLVDIAYAAIDPRLRRSG